MPWSVWTRTLSTGVARWESRWSAVDADVAEIVDDDGYLLSGTLGDAPYAAEDESGLSTSQKACDDHHVHLSHLTGKINPALSI